MICLYVQLSQTLKLSEEYISRDLKIYLSRILDKKLLSGDSTAERKIVIQNDLINRSLQIQGKPIYVLETQEEFYMLPEYAWHNAEFHLIFRRLNSLEVIEYLGELIQNKYFSRKEVNEIFRQHNITFKFVERNEDLFVEFLPEKEIRDFIDSIKNTEPVNVHDNILLLIDRLEKAYQNKDYTLLIATSGSIFETLAKDVLQDPSLIKQSLGWFFDRYRKSSSLPSTILDYMKAIFDSRNTTPTAGHGSTATVPTISDIEARLLIELTKTFVRSEYLLIANDTTKAK